MIQVMIIGSDSAPTQTKNQFKNFQWVFEATSNHY